MTAPAPPTLTSGKAQLVTDLETLLGALAGEVVVVLDYEPTSIPGEQITVTVTAADTQPDYLTYTLRIYAPMADARDGQARQDAVVELIADELPAQWLDPRWEFGWDERLDVFAARATVTTPRGLV